MGQVRAAPTRWACRQRCKAPNTPFRLGSACLTPKAECHAEQGATEQSYAGRLRHRRDGHDQVLEVVVGSWAAGVVATARDKQSGADAGSWARWSSAIELIAASSAMVSCRRRERSPPVPLPRSYKKANGTTSFAVQAYCERRLPTGWLFRRNVASRAACKSECATWLLSITRNSMMNDREYAITGAAGEADAAERSAVGKGVGVPPVWATSVPPRKPGVPVGTPWPASALKVRSRQWTVELN